MFHIIVNPSSSSGRGKSKWDKVETRFKQSGVPYKVHFSSADNTIEKICGELTSRGEECSLVVLGGDGTMNAVVNGIKDFEHTKVGFIQTGSGNDLIKGLGVKKNREETAILSGITDKEEIKKEILKELVDSGVISAEDAEKNKKD